VHLPLATVVDSRFDLYAMVGALAGVYLFYRGFFMLQQKRLIQNTPSSKIRSASMGLVEVSGLAVGPHTIVAPLTGLPCYMHRTAAWEWRSEGKNSRWVKVVDETMHVPFFLDDNTGRLLVDPQGAQTEIHADLCEEFSDSLFSTRLGVPSNAAAFLASHGISCGNKIKVEEYCIKPKNALFVLGTLAENRALTPSAIPVRTEAAESQNFSLRGLPFATSGIKWSASFTVGNGTAVSNIGSSSAGANKPAPALDSPRQQKVAAAMLKAGITNPAAWAAAGVSGGAVSSYLQTAGAAAAAAPAPKIANEQPFESHPPVVIMKGAHNPAFFISWRSRREVVQSLGWKSAAMIWSGPALTLVCVYFLAAQFGWL